MRTRALAWDAHCNGVHAYHAWAFKGSSEETQNGWLAGWCVGDAGEDVGVAPEMVGGVGGNG